MQWRAAVGDRVGELLHARFNRVLNAPKVDSK
jgi:hypothetical protein